MKLVTKQPDPNNPGEFISTEQLVPVEQVAYNVGGEVFPAINMPELIRDVTWSLYKDLGCTSASTSLANPTSGFYHFATGTDGVTTYEVFLEEDEYQKYCKQA